MFLKCLVTPQQINWRGRLRKSFRVPPQLHLFNQATAAAWPPRPFHSFLPPKKTRTDQMQQMKLCGNSVNPQASLRMDVAIPNFVHSHLLLFSTVGTLPEGYVCNVPLPRVPKIQRARSHQVTKIPDYYKDSYAVPMYDITHKLVGSAAYAFSPTCHAIAINT